MKKLGLIAIGALIGATLCFFITGKAKVEELELIAFGAFIGAILSFFATEISAWRRRKEDAKEKVIDIIINVVSFVYKTQEIIDDLIMKKFVFLKTRNLEQKKKYRESLEKVSEKISNLVVQEDTYTFQLQRVGNQEILEKFQKLLDVQTKYIAFFERKIEKPIDEMEKEKKPAVQELLDEFVSDCLEFCRVLAPVRTPGAPDKKKGLPKNG